MVGFRQGVSCAMLEQQASVADGRTNVPITTPVTLNSFTVTMTCGVPIPPPLFSMIALRSVQNGLHCI